MAAGVEALADAGEERHYQARPDGGRETVRMPSTDSAGLPPAPTWLAWFGAPDAELVAEAVSSTAQRTADGASLFSGGPEPLDADQLARLFPALPRELLFSERNSATTGRSGRRGSFARRSFPTWVRGDSRNKKRASHPRRCEAQKPGGDLLSHRVPPAVPSALEGLTSVFGMGTGVAPPALPPENLDTKHECAAALCDFRYSSGRLIEPTRPRPCVSRTDSQRKRKKVVKPHDRLVPVSFAHCCASTPGLSTT